MLITNQHQGFTLIEMIVSLAIFSFIITTAVGALLVLISSNQKLQSEQSVMTNLSFALDSMTREIRTGYNYYCASRPNYSAGSQGAIFGVSDDHEALGTQTNNCASGRPSDNQLQGLSFFEGGNSITGTSTGSRRILYFFDKIDSTIKRRVGNSAPQSIITSGLRIIDAEFFVTGSSPASAGDREQPSVTIVIEAEETATSSKRYHLQTTVVQRVLDL